MKTEEHRTTQDATYGYRRLEPIPRDEPIARFYESHYYDLIRQGGRAPDLRRLMAGGQEADQERSWLQSTLYADVLHVLERYAPGRSVLDVGCGSGDLVASLSAAGYSASGVEPAEDAVAFARSAGLEVHHSTFDAFVDQQSSTAGKRFDAVVLLNVLEHVPDPANFVELGRSVLSPGGLLVIRVPNDFTELQAAAAQQIRANPWWIASPDHINYFDFASLQKLLEDKRLPVVYAQGDFPMELFLLLGDDYVHDRSLGGICHQQRIRFEQSIPPDLRRRIYQALAGVGVGRNCLVAGQLEAQ
jgi:2-polyprenyl-3-methyl-5-hydroxy-6-metoxy-1,4-benzoquinol methylase